MTPARFDILCLLRQPAIRWEERRKRKKRHQLPRVDNMNFLTQKRIQEALDLHHSTISKMLSTLLEMGWITRERSTCGDRRRKVIELTPLGLRRIWRAMRLLWRERILLEDFEAIARYLRPTWPVLESLAHLDDTLALIRRFLGDRSSFFYDWGSQNHSPYWAQRMEPKTKKPRPPIPLTRMPWYLPGELDAQG